MLRRYWRKLGELTRRYFVAGLLVFAPIGVTFWAIGWIVQLLDNLLLPRVLELVFPGLESAPRIPFVGALFTFFVIILIGVFARHFFGNEVVRFWERLLSRVPVARSIYAAVKQLFEALFRSTAASTFNRVVLVEYPRRGLWALAFTTGPARGPIQQAMTEPSLNCFVPTTPNPTSGFYLVVPEVEVRNVDLSVEDAFKLIMSAGLVTPGDIEDLAASGLTTRRATTEV